MAKKETNIIGLKELRENTSKYISAVERGKSFTVIRRAKPIFQITPVDGWGDEGVWETVSDFEEIERGGVEMERITKALKK